MAQKDIVDRTDVELLVNQFYKKVTKDTLLAPFFMQVDWPSHLPIMYNFWVSILLGDFSYQGNPFPKHISLNINTLHFERWLILFNETLDSIFAGPNTDQLKDRAKTIAAIWNHKLATH